MPQSIVAELLRVNRAQLQGIINLGGVRKMRRVYDKVLVELEAKLSELNRAGKGQTFSAFHLHQVLAQVKSGVVQVSQNIGQALPMNARVAANLAKDHHVRAIKRLEKKFAGTEPILRVEEAAVFSKVYKGVEPSLLDRYHKLKVNYPMPTIVRARETLAQSLLSNHTVDEATSKLMGVMQSDWYRAERIVRTEMSYAYGVTNQACLEKTAAQVPQLMKRLVATFDARTGADSKKLNGQTVPVDAPFIWLREGPGGVERVEYMQPPNRPNDREVVIPWRGVYKGGTGEPGPVQARLP